MNYRCRHCGARLRKLYDHVGPRCDEANDSRDCSGTFEHVEAGNDPLCLRAGDVSHTMAIRDG